MSARIEAALPAIREALAMLPGAMNTRAARVVLLAFGLQESALVHRVQIAPGGGRGPARGLWQFERGGGVAGVLRHNASRYWMHSVCGERGVAPKTLDVWRALENDDVLAAAAARLLIFTDPRALPAVDDAAGAWELYMRVWRPGKPKKKAFAANHAEAALWVNLNMIEP